VQRHGRPRALISTKKSGRQDLNLRPLDPQPAPPGGLIDALHHLLSRTISTSRWAGKHFFSSRFRIHCHSFRMANGKLG